MKGYSPKLPLRLDPRDGYRLNRTLHEVIKQNLKMLVLTSPGERIMNPLFGVGLYNFLFELNTQATRSLIMERISQQVSKYMPFVNILQIDFTDPEAVHADRNFLGMRIKYRIPSLNKSDLLRISIERAGG